MPATSQLDETLVKNILWGFASRTEEHAILLLDRQGKIKWSNEGAHRILAASAELLAGRDVAALFTLEDREKGISEHERAVALTSGTAADDRWMLRLNQARFWASGVTASLGESAPDCAYIKVFRDVTEVKMQMESLRERCSAASRASEHANVAIGVLAHELRNPLAAIGLGIDLVEERARDSGDIGPVLKIIDSNVGLASRLIDDLMQHSKLTSSEVSLDRSSTTLRELLATTIAVAKRQMDVGEREVTLLLPSGEADIVVDRMRMQQVFVNLVANALRYTPSPGRVWVTGSFEGSEAIVRVSDQGIGIEPDRLDHLFELFTLPHLKGSKLGLGVGLSLVKKIVDLHGGTVQAKSDGRGKGSQFVVRFPIR